jgi:hypothetical protein
MIAIHAYKDKVTGAWIKATEQEAREIEHELITPKVLVTQPAQQMGR